MEVDGRKETEEHRATYRWWNRRYARIQPPVSGSMLINELFTSSDLQEIYPLKSDPTILTRHLLIAVTRYPRLIKEAGLIEN